MANNKQRYVNTRIWNDTYVSTLDPIEKLLFIYFLTNEHTNISGIYEVPLKIIAIETGIDVSMLEKIMPRLEEKIRYIDGKVIIKNHIKHQEIGSINIIKGITNCLNELDQEWLKDIINKGFYVPLGKGIDTPYIPLGKVSNYSNSNSNSNSNNMSVKKASTKSLKNVVDETDNSFDLFWEKYPKKELKKKAKDIWLNKKLRVHLEKILEFIEKAKKTDRWVKGYIKQPTAFLNGECWNDDLTSYGGANTGPQVYKNNTQDNFISKLKEKTL